MNGSKVLRCLGAAALAVAAIGCWPGAAGAATPTSASLTMTSDAGDWVGGGRSYSYADSGFTANSNGNWVGISLNAANGDWWYLDFSAPAGQTLAPGTYSGATRYPFQAPTEPGLSVVGNGAGCNTVTGTFTVTEVDFGPNNYLERFGTTFEQHCEGGVPALRGEVHIVNPPAPQPLTIDVGLAGKGSVNRHTGATTVSGTVTCSQPSSVTVNGSLSQRANRTTVSSGFFSVQVACSSTPTAWQATVSSAVPFNPGTAQLDATASAFDAAFGQNVTVSSSAEIRLTR